jgi:UDP-N-acetylmuramate dehydrogenase
VSELLDVQWFSQNAGRFGGQLSLDEPLSKHTYYRIGGPARVFAIPKSVEDLEWLAQGIAATGVPLFVLGAGSNLLVSDQGFDGLVVRATRVDLSISLLEGTTPESRIRTGGSVAISTLLRRAAQEGWGGLELLTGIPGSVGGAVVMNAGTHLGESKERLKRVEIFSLLGGGRRSFEPSEFKYEYRKNGFLPPGCVVLSADWEVKLETPEAVKARIDETLARRKATQPIDFPSCGSVFKNPRAYGMSAWAVVDRLGLRGHRIGGAQFAEKHSNFIINLGGATAADVRALIALAKERALKELGVPLEEEVMYVGFIF